MPKLKNPFGKGLFDYLIWFYRCGIKKIVHRIVCSMSPKPPQGRRPTAVEKAEYAICFPKMKTWSVTGEPDGKYNCIAWSVGIEDQWIWPNKGTVKDFDAFYAFHGWSVANHGRREYKKKKIALYAMNSNPNDCRHGSRETHDCGWHESKDGGGLRIMHIQAELEGGKYGHMIRWYEKADESANLDLC